jgi:hypothetical protein
MDCSRHCNLVSPCIGFESCLQDGCGSFLEFLKTVHPVMGAQAGGLSGGFEFFWAG